MSQESIIMVFESPRSDQRNEVTAIEAIFTIKRAEGSKRLRQQGVKKHYNTSLRL